MGVSITPYNTILFHSCNPSAAARLQDSTLSSWNVTWGQHSIWILWWSWVQILSWHDLRWDTHYTCSNILFSIKLCSSFFFATFNSWPLNIHHHVFCIKCLCSIVFYSETSCSKFNKKGLFWYIRESLQLITRPDLKSSNTLV